MSKKRVLGLSSTRFASNWLPRQDSLRS